MRCQCMNVLWLDLGEAPLMPIGIDPGLRGAGAVLDHAGVLMALHDTPVLTLRTSRGIRQEYDVPGLAALLAP